MLKRAHSPSPTTPWVGVPTSQRDACAAGTPPPGALTPGEAAPANQPPSQLDPDASRNPLTRVGRALELFDEIIALGLNPQPQLHDLPRDLYDALPGSSAWFSTDGVHREFWTKTLKTPRGRRCPAFTYQPPIDDAA